MTCPLSHSQDHVAHRVVRFLGEFCSTAQQRNAGLATALIREYMPLSKAQDKTVRQRACQLIGELMARLPDDTSDDGTLCAHASVARVCACAFVLAPLPLPKRIPVCVCLVLSF